MLVVHGAYCAYFYDYIEGHYYITLAVSIILFVFRSLSVWDRSIVFINWND